MTLLAALPVRMSVEAFLVWASGDDQRWQLVDGAPHAMAPPTRLHGWLQGELGRLIGNHLRAARPGCSAIMNPGIVPRLMSEHNMRIPDLAVTCTPNDRDERALSDPRLIVEILSPSNQAATWSNVWAYTSIPSVLDILILHTDRVGASLLSRQPGGQWPDRPTGLDDGEFHLASIGLTIRLRDVYATTRLAGQ